LAGREVNLIRSKVSFGEIERLALKCHGKVPSADTTIRTAGPTSSGNPFFDVSWLADEEVQ